MKICILENKQAHIDHILALLNRWELENNIHLEIDCLSSGKELLSKNNLNYHIIFIDIKLGNSNGIEVAQLLRKMKYENAIVFLTAYREYVFEGYDVRALNYILKPAEYKKLDLCLQYVHQELLDSYFIYQYRNDITRIPYNSILYLASCNQYTEIVTLDHSFRQAEPLKKMFNRLPKQFVRCHRTTIVNMYHIRKISKKDIILSNGTCLPISQTYLEAVKNAFIQYTKLTFRPTKN